MRMRFGLLMLAAFLFILAPLTAQDNNFVEAWFLYEQGKAKLEEPAGPEMGEALLAFQEAVEKRGGVFPEAEMAIGDIYFREGAFALARRQYEKAYALRTGMDIPEEKYTVLYRLADLSEMQELYGDMDGYLRQILRDQPYFTGERFQNYQDAFLSTYYDDGLDHLFRLYRMDGVAFAAAAHGKLGWFYYRTGRPSAVLQCLFALDIVVTESVNELRRVNPRFEFTTVQAFLDAALQRENIASYLVRSDFYKTLYYLGASTYAASHPQLAESVWRILATYPLRMVGPAATTYAELSSRQLQSPWIEPYINPSARRIEPPQ